MAVSALHHFLNLFLIIRHFNLFLFLFLLMRILVNPHLLHVRWLFTHLDVYVNLLDKLFLDPDLHYFLEHGILCLAHLLISQLADDPSQTSWLALLYTLLILSELQLADLGMHDNAVIRMILHLIILLQLLLIIPFIFLLFLFSVVGLRH